MGIFLKISGLIGSVWQLGLGGPKIKNNSGVIEYRNAADDAFAVARGAAPVAGNDLATKNYVDGFESGEMQTYRFPINNTAAQASTNSIPLNARVYDASLEVTTPYSAGATIAIGNSATANLFMSTTDNEPQTANTYSVPQDTDNGIASTIRVAVAGAPAVGAGVVVVKASKPLP